MCTAHLLSQKNCRPRPSYKSYAHGSCHFILIVSSCPHDCNAHFQRKRYFICGMDKKHNRFALYNLNRKQYNKSIADKWRNLDLKDTIQNKLYRIAIRLEILVGLCILVTIAAATFGLFLDIRLSAIISAPEMLQSYLTTAMTIIIGIEFVKMIFSYNIDTVVEVMMLAVARQMVLTHTSPTDNLLTVISVAFLFMIRKFLFIRQLDHVHAEQPDSLFPFFKRRTSNTTPPDTDKNDSVHHRKEDETTHAAS